MDPSNPADIRKAMGSLTGISGEFKYNEPMGRHTSLRIGGEASVFVEINDWDSMQNLCVTVNEFSIPLMIIGGGSNILFSDSGFYGVVASTKRVGNIDEMTGAKESEECIMFYADAGASLQRLVSMSKKRGLPGLEGLVGVPGTVGGAVFGNAGAFGYEIKDVIVSVTVVDRKGALKTIERDTLDFGYRDSGIGEGMFITGVVFRLRRGDVDAVSSLMDGFMNKKRDTQPVGEFSAGCVFRNPEGMFAGKLIEDAGCKGMRVGDIEVSRKHANFFVNRGNGSAKDFMNLKEEVASRVKVRFGVDLESEIKIVG